MADYIPEYVGGTTTYLPIHIYAFNNKLVECINYID